MTYCLNPNCQQPQNPNNTKFCLSCGNKLLLKERYYAIKPIGQGGFGKTFLAIDGDKPAKPPCVIKQFFPSSQGTGTLKKATELFNQEAVRLEELGKHSQIPELYAHFEQDNCLYLVQEYIDGENLESLLQTDIFNENKIRELLTNLLPVLEFIHERNVIHRDIKPENIIQRRSDKAFILVDFGAAKHATGTALLNTRNNTIIGDIRYMSPEQLSGKVNFTSDLYCLGVTCLHLLTSIDPLQLFDTNQDKWVWKNYLKLTISNELENILNKMVAKAINARYQSVKEISEALNVLISKPSSNFSKILSACQKDKKWGYIDETCTFVISPQYDQAKEFNDGLARVRIGNQWGIIDQSGTLLGSLAFDEIHYLFSRLHKIKKNEKWGIINELGKLSTALEFEEVQIFSEGLFKVKKYGKWGVVNENFTTILPCEFDEIWNFEQGLAKIKKHGKWGLIDNFVKIVLPVEFDEIQNFSQGLAKIKKHGKWGLINNSAKIVLSCEFDEVWDFYQGLAKIKKHNKYGLINDEVKIILDTTFEEIESIFEDLIKIAIKINDKEKKYGYANRDGQIVIPCQFYEADNFSNGKAKVKKEYYINKNGECIN